MLVVVGNSCDGEEDAVVIVGVVTVSIGVTALGSSAIVEKIAIFVRTPVPKAAVTAAVAAGAAVAS